MTAGNLPEVTTCPEECRCQECNSQGLRYSRFSRMIYILIMSMASMIAIIFKMIEDQNLPHQSMSTETLHADITRKPMTEPKYSASIGLMFAIGIFHLLLFICTIGAKNSEGIAAVIHRDLWPIKLGLLGVFSAASVIAYRESCIVPGIEQLFKIIGDISNPGFFLFSFLLMQNDPFGINKKCASGRGVMLFFQFSLAFTSIIYGVHRLTTKIMFEIICFVIIFVLTIIVAIFDRVDGQKGILSDLFAAGEALLYLGLLASFGCQRDDEGAIESHEQYALYLYIAITVFVVRTLAVLLFRQNGPSSPFYRSNCLLGTFYRHAFYREEPTHDQGLNESFLNISGVTLTTNDDERYDCQYNWSLFHLMMCVTSFYVMSLFREPNCSPFSLTSCAIVASVYLKGLSERRFSQTEEAMTADFV